MKRAARYIAGLIFLLVVTGGLSASSWAQTTDSQESAILVLDASGSMWGQIGGKAKIEIARDVIAGLVRDFPENTTLGLTAYGHRRKGDCGDIEHLKDPGPIDPETFVSLVKDISPVGMTPLSEAVRQAAVRLKHTEQVATVILVSDGLETCNADPCAMAKELSETGVAFTVHVVGFDLKEEERKALQCIADNTGGMFLHAENADTLKTALATTMNQSAKATTIFVPVLEQGGQVPTIAAEWSIYSATPGTDEPGELVFSDTANVVQRDFESGRYVVEATYANAVGRAVVEVGDRQRERHEVVLNAGNLSVEVLNKEGGERYQGPPYSQLSVQLVGSEDKDDQFTHIGNPRDFMVREGIYEVVASVASLSARAEVEVKQGETTVVSLPLDSGRVRLSALTKEGGNLYSGSPYIQWAVHPISSGGKPSRDPVATDIDNRTQFVLSPGRYLIRAEAGVLSGELEVDVIVDETKEASMVLPSGKLSLLPFYTPNGTRYRGAPFVNWKVFQTDSDGRALSTALDTDIANVGNFVLPPGRFFVTADAGPLHAETFVAIEPDGAVERNLSFEAGRVQLTFLHTATKQPLTGLGIWRIYEIQSDGSPASSYVAYSTRNPDQISLPAGKYLARATVNKTEIEGRFEVKPGDDTNFEVLGNPP